MSGLPKKKKLKKGLNYRTLSLRMEGGAPSSLDLDTRSVEVIGATEGRVRVFDWERWEVVEEILLMSGCEIPENRQVVMLDSHWRVNTQGVVGSYREMVVEGENLVGRAHYSKVDELADMAYEKMREGHLTDYSLGYAVKEAVWVPEGESTTINGRTFEGPVKIATRWVPKELSTCPIGADEMAKVRAEGGPVNNHHTEEDSMKVTPKLRAALEKRGLPENATDVEVVEFMERVAGGEEGQRIVTDPPPAKVPATDDVEKIRSEAAGGERTRIIEIDAMCARFDCVDQAAGLIAGGKTLDEGRSLVMDAVAKRYEDEDQDGPGSLGFRVEVGTTDTEKFRAAAVDSLLLRGDVTIKKVVAGAEELRGYSLRELARLTLQRSGVRASGNPMEMIGRALTSEDLPVILGAVANKSLLAGFEQAEETWGTWCGDGSVSDFKIHKAGRLSESDDLEELGDGSQYKYGDRDEHFEEYEIATYGRIFPITRHSIINDDLNALTVIPMQHGEAASRKIGDVAYAVLTANAAMGDNTALFHADHANLAGAGAVLGVATLGAGIKAMKIQKDIKGKRTLNVKPQYYVGPVSVEAASEVFFKSEKFDATAKDATRVNPYAGDQFIRVYEPRLDDDSATAWYLVGRKGKFIKIYFLNGVKTPYLEVKNGWSVDGVEHKVRIDCGAKAMDWRTGYKNAGA